MTHQQDQLHSDPLARSPRPDARVLLLSLAVTVILFNLLGPNSSIASIASGTVLILAALTIGARRTERGRDLFHPLAFPTAYIGLSFLVPVWVFITQRSPMRFDPDSFASNTANLVTIGLACLVAGLAWPWRPSKSTVNKEVDGSTLLHGGRLLAATATVLTMNSVRLGAIEQRGLAQTTYGLTESVTTATLILGPLSLLLIALGHRAQHGTERLRLFDWLLVAALATSIGLTGERGGTIVVLLMLLYVHTRGRVRPVVTLTLFSAMAAVTVLILSLREVARGNRAQRSGVLEVLAGDWSVATYTTGITAASVPENAPFALGHTYVVAILRQLPSPVANRLLGQPHDTATYRFREMIGYSNPNQGFGYSLPAEGYLNFGIFGLIIACLMFGLMGSWLYNRPGWPSARLSTLAYAIYVTALPAMLRSDALGTIKALLYPLLIATVILFLARWAHGRRHRHRDRLRRVTAAP